MGAGDGSRSEPGWHVETLASTLVVGDGATRLSECWSVVADQPLDEVLVELDLDPVPGTGGTLSSFLAEGGAVDVAYGGELLPECWPASCHGRSVVGIRLPRPLEPQEPHEFRLLLTAPAAIAPLRHVHVPAVPCAHLALRVRFVGADRGVTGRPAGAWLVEAVLPGEPEPLEPFEVPVLNLPLDAVGEVAATFRQPVPGLGYGLQWPPC